MLLGIAQRVFEQRSPFQEIVIAEVPVYGRALFLDAGLQLSALDERIYHEHLVVPAFACHPWPRRVLIIGGGDGLALREALADARVEQVTLVDIDHCVVDACRAHLRALHGGSFDDPRAHIVIADARAWLAGCRERFDVVLVDLVDPEGKAGRTLYREVVDGLHAALAPGAVVAGNAGTVDPPGFPALQVLELLEGRFRYAALQRIYVPSFAKSWGLCLASDAVDVRAAQVAEGLAHRRAALQALVPEAFPGALRLPAWLEAVRRDRGWRDLAPEFRWVAGDAAG